MPFAGYEDFDECVRKNKDKKDPKAYCAEIKRKTEKSVRSVDILEEDESDTPAIDKVVDKFAKGGPGSGQKGHRTSDLRRHSQYTSSDYSALKKKGYTDKEIGGIWDKDKKSGKKPLHRKEIPKMDESVKAKKISERLKSESTSKTPAIDALIKKSKTSAIDAFIQKGGPGSGIKGHTTAKELAIKKKFEELGSARDKADALAEKDINEGQRMIDQAAKDSEAAFEDMLTLEAEGTRAQYAEATKKKERIQLQEAAGWDLRIKGQNRKAEISEKYHTAAMKVMSPKRRNAPSIKAIRVEGVDAYESTHGKKPRGTGLWVFQIGEDSGNTYSAETPFKEAQKQAKKQAQKEMKRSVKLLP